MRLIDKVNKQSKHAKFTIIRSVHDLPDVKYTNIGDIFQCLSNNCIYVNVNKEYVVVLNSHGEVEYTWS